MTETDFRQLALSLPGAIESAHRNHPDFRAHGKIFATLRYPASELGMVKVTPEQQQELVDAYPGMFAPVSGGWGRGGATQVRLDLVTETTLLEALHMAWEHSKPKPKARRVKS